jgi:aryl-alcohol dehydrogenase-like predicted oxidoreductase
VETVQIIFNMFRQRAADRFFELATQANVGVIVRVPLASGLLTGKMTADSTFSADDHRSYNRNGETFAGVPYETGLAAVAELSGLVPDVATMAQMALRWILMHNALSTTIPGAKNADQAIANAAASDLPAIDAATMAAVSDVYERTIAEHVHARW